MERLRTAIEQARKTRDQNSSPEGADVVEDHPVNGSNGATNGSGTNGNGTHTNGAASNIDISPEAQAVRDRWDALPMLTLKAGRLRRNRVISGGKGQERAAYDMLRTRLLTSIQKEGWRRVAVTSPTMACGKSTTAVNLAFSLSRLPDIRTLVIEADMRRPSMAKMLGVRGKTSVFDILSGKAEFAENAVRIADNVAVAMNHGVARNPAELLHSQGTPAILDMIDEAYKPDVILFDMPPLMQSDDTLGFVKHVDCALLVALAEQTTLDQVDFCETELAGQTNVAGVVLNRCRYTGPQYGYGYGEY